MPRHTITARHRKPKSSVDYGRRSRGRNAMKSDRLMVTLKKKQKREREKVRQKKST